MNEPTVRLRPITEADLPNYVRWFNDPEVIQWLSREPGLTLDEEREWFKRISAPDHRDLNLAIEADGRHIGGTGLDFHPDGRTATFGICIGDKASWGRGCGTTTVREVLRIGFEERGLHRIQLGARADNARAIRCYAKCGFRHEGREHRAAIYAGEWHDNVLMAILREEWEADRNASSSQTVAPGNGVCIRGYRPADYDQVADLWRAVGFSIRVGDSAQALDRKVARDPDLVLVAELDGRVVGTAMGGFDGRRAWINRLAVHPDVQRRGIGRRLMAEVEQRLATLGVTRAALETTVDRAPALRFYERLGYENHYHIIVLSKELAAPPESSDGA